MGSDSNSSSGQVEYDHKGNKKVECDRKGNWKKGVD